MQSLACSYLACVNCDGESHRGSYTGDGCTKGVVVDGKSCMDENRIEGVVVDGKMYGLDTPLEDVELWVGSMVKLVTACHTSDSVCCVSDMSGLRSLSDMSGLRSPHSDASKGSSAHLVVTGGLCSGVTLATPKEKSNYVIGRSRDCDVVIDDMSVSRRHMRVITFHKGRPVVDDLTSRNGVSVAGKMVSGPTLVSAGDAVRVGATRLEWRANVRDTPVAVRSEAFKASGKVTFNRPPRRAPSQPSGTLSAPGGPPEPPQIEALSWTSMVLPVVAGLFMAIVWSPFMAVFAVLGPMLTVGTWLERRRRTMRKHQSVCEDISKRVQRFADSLPSVWALERRRRVEATPDLAEIIRRARNRSVRCWERRLDDVDAMQFGIGTSDVQWKPRLVCLAGAGISGDVDESGHHASHSSTDSQSRKVAADALAAVEAIGKLKDVPVAVSLAFGEVIGIVGPIKVARSLARSLILQAAVLHGPADMTVIGLTPRHKSRDTERPKSSESRDTECCAGMQCVRTMQDDCSFCEWNWMRWLPHTMNINGEILIGTDMMSMNAAVESVKSDRSQRACLAVADGKELFSSTSAPGRALFGLERVSGIVIATDPHELPSLCTTVVEVWHSSGGLRLVNPRTNRVLEPVIAWGVTLDTATDVASCLARLDDSELAISNTHLPDVVPLIRILADTAAPARTVKAAHTADTTKTGHIADTTHSDTDTCTSIGITCESVLRNWSNARAKYKLSTVMGVSSVGPLEFDFVADGPHMLVGGTTGSGKSELLRSLVAGLALSASPEMVAFVLIDYKGGAAFDRCADMPHVAGMVTDLDDYLAERALVCLEAELRYRETRLRQAGVDNLADFQDWLEEQSLVHGTAKDPLPRLVVVVDEFASLAAELPDFLDSLVNVAQRGRSLGVHLVLATQRPAGVITEDIRANMSCRVALRVTDANDSSDVIGVPDAANISRRVPGRAFIRFGPDEHVLFQSALVTGCTPSVATGLRGLQARCVDESRNLIASSERAKLSSLNRAKQLGSTSENAAIGGTSPASDLDCVVGIVCAAHEQIGGVPPRSPWPYPLADEISTKYLQNFPVQPLNQVAWLLDDPANQRQVPGGWRPSDGHLVVIGGPGSGSSTTLMSVALDLCRNASPEGIHIYAIDFNGGMLMNLNGLPHTGATVSRSDSERRVRLLRYLEDEISRRAATLSAGAATSGQAADTALSAGAEAWQTTDVAAGAATSADSCKTSSIVLIIDDLAGLGRAHDIVRDHEPHRHFAHIWGNGPAVGVHVIVSVRRAADLPSELASTSGMTIVHATKDIDGGLSVRVDTSKFKPGRAIRTTDNKELQVARPCGGDFVQAVAEIANVSKIAYKRSTPATVGVLPAVIEPQDLPVEGVANTQCVKLRFAMGDLSLLPLDFTLHNGEHALVIGPARSGRTSTLAAIGLSAAHAGLDVVVVAHSQRSKLADILEVKAITVDMLQRNREQGCYNRVQQQHSCEQGFSSSRAILLVDDAYRVEDTPEGVLAAISREGRCEGRNEHLIAAVTADRLRGGYGHWLMGLRECYKGVLFRPGPVDGDLLGIALPSGSQSARMQNTSRPGYGLIVSDGEFAAGQVVSVDGGQVVSVG